MKSSRYIAVFAASVLLWSCLESGADVESTPSGGADAGFDGTGPWPTDAGNTEPVCSVSSHEDSDGDGLLDILEDSNRNCRLDSGETDPFATDSDGDGLADGDEDVDRNGQWDDGRGELDPRVADTDGDGTVDGDEPIAAFCNSTLYDVPDRVAFAGREVYLDRPALLSESYEDSAWIDFGNGHLDWVTTRSTRAPAATETESRVWFEAVTERGILQYSDWDVESSGELFAAMLAEEMVTRIPGNEFASDGPFSVGFHQTDDGRSRVTVSPSDFGLEVASAEVISPSSATVLRARCLEAEGSEPLDSVDLVFVFSTDDASLRGAVVVFESLAEVMAIRSAVGLATRIWMVRADAHVGASAGAPLGGQGFEDPAEARAFMAELSAGDSDQRVWMNARAAIQSLSMGRLQGAPALITLGSREDPEYRDGTTEGYDGHAFGAPHPAGATRDALNRFYVEFFQATVSNRQVHLLAENCDVARTHPSSSRELASRGRGVFVDLCGSHAEAMMRQEVRRTAEAVLRVAGDDRLLPGSSQSDAEWSDDSPTGNGLGWVPIDTDTPIAVGYLFWDSLPENE